MNLVSAQQLNQALDNSKWPIFNNVSLISDSTDSTQLSCALSIHSSLSYLAGHFPTQPVLPGVVQVHWAGELAQRLFACKGFFELKKVKFISVIVPPAEIRLELKQKSGCGDISFDYCDDHQRYSTGVISFQ